MELLIYNYTGYETEFEVSILKDGKITFNFYVVDITTMLSLDHDDHGKVTINNIKCITYDDQDNQKPYIPSQDEITNLEKELPHYIDWNEWYDHNSQPNDDYEQKRFNQMD